jgi:hypothetical protein
MRRNAPLGLGVGERKHRIGRAARFERTHLLQVLALEKQLCAGSGVQRLAGEHRRAIDLVANTPVRGADRIKRQRCSVGQRGIGHGLCA